MKIPSKYQIFDAPVVLDSKDAERLSFHLTNWNKLNEMFMLGVNAPDLRRLVVMEMLGRRRMAIISRLLGRLARVQRKHLLGKVREALA